MVKEMASGAGDSSSDGAMVAPAYSPDSPAAIISGATRLAPFLSRIPSLSTTANQSEVISQFLREVRIPSSEASDDSGTMRYRTDMAVVILRPVFLAITTTRAANRAAVAT